MSSPDTASDRLAASTVPAAQRAALDAWTGAGFAIDPKSAVLLAVNAPARELFPSLEPGRGLALDGAMPAVRRLRELVRADNVPDGPVPLVFWTPRGIRALPCLVERGTTSNGRILFLVKEVRSEPRSAPVSADPAVAQEGPPSRTDEETLAEIARRIRQGQQRHAAAPPLSTEIDQTKVPAVRASNSDDTNAPAATATANAAGAAQDTEWVGDAAAGIDLAHLAHELKTPLSAIAAAAEIMTEGRFGEIGNARYAGYVADIHASARHALELIERMLGRGLKDQRPALTAPRFERLELDALVESCLSAVKPLAEAKGVRMRSRRVHSKAVVTADGTALKQIVLNLLTNALKFTPARGTITVSTVGSRHGAAALTIEDTGPGMTAAAIADALRATRSGAPALREGGGLGLGLPLSRALAEAMGATLSIDSAPGKGTRVTVAFPGGPLVAI